MSATHPGTPEPASPDPLTPGRSAVAALEEAWTGLADDLDGDRTAVTRFATSWVGLLSTRVAALERATHRADHEAVRDNLLSFSCTSAMLGVEGLMAAADRALATLDRQGVRKVYRHLDDIGRQSRDATLLVMSRLAQPGWSNR